MLLLCTEKRRGEREYRHALIQYSSYVQRCDRVVTKLKMHRTPQKSLLPYTVGFPDLVGTGIAPVPKKLLLSEYFGGFFQTSKKFALSKNQMYLNNFMNEKQTSEVSSIFLSKEMYFFFHCMFTNLKVRKSQKQFFLKLHCPKNERNVRQNSAL